MKKQIGSAAIIAAVVVLCPGPVLPETESIDAKEILERTADREFQDMELSIHMVRVNKKGRERPMDLVVKSRKTVEVTKAYAEFTAPIEVEGMKSLTWDYTDPEKPTDQWFMLSGMDYMKCRGKACQNMEERFGFSSQSFAFDVEDAEHELVGTENIDGAPCYKIESRAKDQDKYETARVTVWVDKEKFVLRKIEAFDKNDKPMHTSTFTEFKELGDHWWETKGEMTSHQSGKKMRFEIKEAKIDSGIPDQVFAKPKKFKIKEDDSP